MNEFPSLTEIAAEHNLLVGYMKYVDKCIDERRLPMKYDEWLFSYKEESLNTF